MNTKAIKIEYVVWMSIFAFVSVFALYIYMVNTTVVSVVQRKVAVQEIHEMESHIAELEAQYAMQRTKITREYAYDMGYIEPSVVEYVSLNSDFGMMVDHGGR